MASSSDVLRLKTDDELRFFVENPSYYQPELVQAARQELRRRAPAPLATAPPQPASGPLAPPASPPAPETTLDDAAPRRGASWLLPASVALVLLLAGLGFWGKASRHQPVAAVPRAAPAPVAPQPAPLETAISAPPLPTYDTESYVEQALTRVPAVEKANAQRLSQYQALSRRFWAAQQPSAYLLGQVQANHPNPVFNAQATLVLDLWREFDRALIYSYDFGPVMSHHFTCMKTIARHQRDALTKLAEAAANHQPVRLTDADLVAEQQALPALLAPLKPSPGGATRL